MAHGSIRWIEMQSSQEEELRALGRELSIHPLALEDCLHSNQRAKFEDFDTHQLLVWFALVQSRVYELEMVIFPGVVLLVSNHPAPNGKTWMEFLNLQIEQKDAHHLVYQVLDRALDLSAAHVLSLGDSLDDFERKLLQTAHDPRALLNIKRRLAKAEFTLGYLSSVAKQYQQFLNPKDDLKWRLRDLVDHCERVHQNLMYYRSQISTSMEMYWGVTAKRTNDQIKKLTLVASVAIPMTFWSSFWGMNFQSIPYHKTEFFYVAMAVMLGSGVGVYLILKRKGYWEKDL